MLKYVIAAALSAAILLFGFNQSDPEVPKLAAVHALSVFGFFWLLSKRDWIVPRAVLFVAAFYLWAVLSLTWSADWRGGVIEIANATAYLGIFILVAVADRDALRALFPAIACVSVAFFASHLVWPQYFSGFGNENFEIEFALMLLPVLLIGGKRYWVLSLPILWVIATNASNIKWFALAATVAAGLVYLWVMRYRWLSAVIGLSGLNVCLALGLHKDEEILHSVGSRIELTTNALAMWLNSPLIGNGVGSFNVLYPNFQEAHLKLFPGLGTIFASDITYFAGAAHNEYAQVLSDYGLIGFALVCAIGWLAFGRARDRLDWAAFGGLFYMATCAAIGFPWQNVHTGALGAVLLGIACNGRNGLKVSLPRIPVAAVAVAASIFLGTVTSKTWAAQQHFTWTRSTIEQHPAIAVLENLNAYNSFPWSRHIRHQLAMSVAVAFTQDTGSIEIAPEAADRIFEISRSAGGRATSLEIARIEYLLSADRAEESRDEIESRLAWLKEHASAHCATWLMEAKWALVTGQKERAASAVKIAEHIPGALSGFKKQVQQIAMLIDHI